MSQIKTYQHFVFKLHTQRLKKAGWSLSLTLADARRNGELVALADSTLLRFMRRSTWGTWCSSRPIAWLRSCMR